MDLEDARWNTPIGEVVREEIQARPRSPTRADSEEGEDVYMLDESDDDYMSDEDKNNEYNLTNRKMDVFKDVSDDDDNGAQWGEARGSGNSEYRKKIRSHALDPDRAV